MKIEPSMEVPILWPPDNSEGIINIHYKKKTKKDSEVKKKILRSFFVLTLIDQGLIQGEKGANYTFYLALFSSFQTCSSA